MVCQQKKGASLISAPWTEPVQFIHLLHLKLRHSFPACSLQAVLQHPVLAAYGAS